VDADAVAAVRSRCPQLFDPAACLGPGERDVARAWFKEQRDAGASVWALCDVTGRTAEFVTAELRAAGVELGSRRGPAHLYRRRTSGSQTVPGPGHLLLAAYARMIRATRELPVEAVADRIGRQPAVIREWEAGTRLLTAADVTALARLYRLSVRHRSALVEMLPAGQVDDRWESVTDHAWGAEQRSRAVLHNAHRVRHFAPCEVPGEFWGPRACRLVPQVAAGPVPIPPVAAGEGRRTWDLIIAEPLLRSGPPELRAAQMAHLIGLSNLGTVEIRVLCGELTPGQPPLSEYTFPAGDRLWRDQGSRYVARAGGGRRARLDSLTEHAEPPATSRLLIAEAWGRFTRKAHRDGSPTARRLLLNVARGDLPDPGGPAPARAPAASRP
jgi:hypothetical protein